MEMNPRIQDGDFNLYQKEPDLISPHIPSLSRKSLEGFEPTKSSFKPNSLCTKSLLDPSLKMITDKSLGLNDPRKLSSLTNSNFLTLSKQRITNAKSVDNILRVGAPKSPIKRSTTKKPEVEKFKKKTLFELKRKIISYLSFLLFNCKSIKINK